MPYSHVTRTMSGADAIAYARGGGPYANAAGRGHNGMAQRNIYVDGVNMLPDEVVPFEKQMQPFWDRARSNHTIQADRFVISFALEELDPDKPEDCLTALRIAREFALENAPDAQHAIFVQADGVGGKLHIHDITNDVRMSNCKGIDPKSYLHAHFSKTVDRICSKYFKLAQPEAAPERVTRSVRGKRLRNEQIRAENERRWERIRAEDRFPRDGELLEELYVWRDDLCARIHIAATGATDLASFAENLWKDMVELVPYKRKDGTYSYIHPATKKTPEHFVYELFDTRGFEPGKVPSNLRARSHKLGANYQPGPDGVERWFLRMKEPERTEEAPAIRMPPPKPPAAKKPAPAPKQEVKPVNPALERARQEAMRLAREIFFDFMGWRGKAKKLVDGREEDDEDEEQHRTRLWEAAWERFKRWQADLKKRYEEAGKRLGAVVARDRSGRIFVMEENLKEQFGAFLDEGSEQRRKKAELQRKAMQDEMRRGTDGRDYTDN